MHARSTEHIAPDIHQFCLVRVEIPNRLGKSSTCWNQITKETYHTEPHAGWPLITAAFPSALSRIYTFSIFPTNIYKNKTKKYCMRDPSVASWQNSPSSRWFVYSLHPQTSQQSRKTKGIPQGSRQEPSAKQQTTSTSTTWAFSGSLFQGITILVGYLQLFNKKWRQDEKTTRGPRNGEGNPRRQMREIRNKVQ